jgi:heat shock protein HslJ
MIGGTMSEEELNGISPEEELEAPAPESEAPAEESPVEQVAEEEPEQKKRGWVVAVLTILGILLLCCVLATCITAAITVFSGGDTATPLPTTEATAVPTAQPTQQPTDAYIKIDEPVQGAVLDITKPVIVKGTGAGLPEGNVVVEAIDRDGNVLAQQPTTMQGKDVGTGGKGTWQVELQIQTQPGMAGRIVAYSKSPLDNSTIAEDAVEVSFGSTPAVKSYIKIDEPSQGAVLDIDRPVTISGSGAGLPEGNLVVQAFDQDENLLVEEPTTLQGPDVGTGGEGTWKVRLNIPAEAGTDGLIVAISRSPADNSKITEDWIDVTFGSAPAPPPQLEIDEPAEGAVLDTSAPVPVSGTGAGLHEGTVIVQALDAGGNVLAEQATTLQGSDVASGGAGTWSVELIVRPPAGTPGQIVAFSPSPDGGSHDATATVNVTYDQQVPSLEGPTWILDGTMPGTEITAQFENGQVSGFSGCNNYSGAYITTPTASGNTISISGLSPTMKTCQEEIMDQETLYLNSLIAATRYTIQDNELTIYYPGGSLIYYSQ